MDKINCSHYQKLTHWTPNYLPLPLNSYKTIVSLSVIELNYNPLWDVTEEAKNKRPCTCVLKVHRAANVGILVTKIAEVATLYNLTF